jgi:hypothetical protein
MFQRSYEISNLTEWVTLQADGKVDYVGWCGRIQVHHMPILAESIQKAYGKVGTDGLEWARIPVFEMPPLFQH